MLRSEKNQKRELNINTSRFKKPPWALTMPKQREEVAAGATNRTLAATIKKVFYNNMKKRKRDGYSLATEKPELPDKFSS
jgi:hypothetical protein